MSSDELFITRILIVKYVWLCFLAGDVVIKLVNESVVVEFACNKRKSAVDSIILVRNVVDSHITNHYGQQ